jgi:hypothetical protein
VQGGALALNAGDMIGRRAGILSSEVVSSQITRRAGSLGITTAAKEVGGKWSGDALGRVAGSVAGRVVGTVAGEATGMAAAEAIGAAAGPVGWVIDGALGIGFAIEAIVEAVKKAHEKKEMSNTINPTLKQYGIQTI